MSNQLARLSMLNAKSQKTDTISGGFGGIKPEDIAGGLAYSKLHKYASHFIRVKFSMCGEDQERALQEGSIQRIIQFCLEIDPKNSGDRFNEDRLGRFVNMIVRQNIAPAKCFDCNGKGEDGFRRLCISCNGTGNQKHTVVAKACLSNISDSSYRRKWVKHEKQINYILDQWQSLAARRLAVQLA